MIRARFGWIATVLVAALLAAGCAAETRPRVTVALKPDRNPDQMLVERTWLEHYLAERLGADVSVVVPLSGNVILEGFANGTIDLAYVSAFDMLIAESKGHADPLLAGRIDGATSYRSYWLVRKDEKAASIADFKGRRVAFASRTSTSGYLVPHAALVARGLLPKAADPEVFFGTGNVHYGSGYVSAVERLLAGDADAAAVSDYVFDKNKHLKPDQKTQLRVLEANGPVPTHVIAVRRALPAALREQLKAALLALDAPQNSERRDLLFTSALVEVDGRAHLEPLRQALEATGRLDALGR